LVGNPAFAIERDPLRFEKRTLLVDSWAAPPLATKTAKLQISRNDTVSWNNRRMRVVTHGLPNSTRAAASNVRNKPIGADLACGDSLDCSKNALAERG